MKKKLLSVLLVICMVLTLMPMAAFAAEFSDTDGHWGKDSIDRWASLGVLNGKGDGVFDPNGSMTRAEFAQMLCNLMGYTKKAENTFTDIPDDAWFADAMLKLVAAGVINGVGENMAAPNAPITREMAAVMLCRAFDLQASSADMSFADAGDVSGWARGAVAALTEKGMLNGVGNNSVAPQLNINRASVAKLVDNMVADYVTEDKTITGEVKGIVIVAGEAKVTFEDAVVTAPVVVAPSAEGAAVELTGATTAENVVVAAEKAAVTVGKDAAAGTVTAAAANAEVKVEGTAGTVAVTGEGAKAEVSGTATTVAVSGAGAKAEVSGTASTVAVSGAGAQAAVSGTADNVTLSGEGTKAEVSGTVKNVEVAEGADKAEVTAAEGGKIESVTTAAADVSVTGKGEVGKVTAEAGSVDVSTTGTDVENKGAETVTAGGGEVAVGETGKSDGTSQKPTVSTDKTVRNDAGVVPAPLADQETGDNKIPDTKLGTITVSSKKNAESEDGAFVYDVVITGRNIMNHKSKNEDPDSSHWVGFGVEVHDEASVFKGKAADDETYSKTFDERTITVDRKDYQTIYFEETDEATFKTAKYTIQETYTPAAADTQDDGDDGDDGDADADTPTVVTYTYNVSFDVTFWKPLASNVEIGLVDPTTAEEPAEGSDEEVGEAEAPIFAKDVFDKTTVSGTKITLSGKLAADAEFADAISYVLTPKGGNYFVGFAEADSATGVTALTADEETAATITVLPDTNSFVVTTNILDADGQFIPTVTDVFTAKDAAGREQGKLTITLDTSACKIAGKNYVDVEINDGAKIVTQKVAVESSTGEDAAATTIDLITPDSSASVYYTGKWTLTKGGDYAKVVEPDGEGEDAPATLSIAAGTPDGTKISVTAERFYIKAQAAEQRPASGDKNGDYTGTYSTLYKAAGISSKAGSGSEYVITIDVTKLGELSGAAVDALHPASGGMANYAFYGIQFAKPDGATTLIYASDYTGLEPSENVINLTEDSVDAKGDVLNGQYIEYYDVGTVSGGVLTPYSSSTDRDEDTRYFMWLKETGDGDDATSTVLAVTKITIKWDYTNVPAAVGGEEGPAN